LNRATVHGLSLLVGTHFDRMATDCRSGFHRRGLA
jgi:hypothetical protein